MLCSCSNNKTICNKLSVTFVAATLLQTVRPVIGRVHNRLFSYLQVTKKGQVGFDDKVPQLYTTRSEALFRLVAVDRIYRLVHFATNYWPTLSNFARVAAIDGQDFFVTYHMCSRYGINIYQ